MGEVVGGNRASTSIGANGADQQGYTSTPAHGHHSSVNPNTGSGRPMSASCNPGGYQYSTAYSVELDQQTEPPQQHYPSRAVQATSPWHTRSNAHNSSSSPYRQAQSFAPSNEFGPMTYERQIIPTRTPQYGCSTYKYGLTAMQTTNNRYLGSANPLSTPGSTYGMIPHMSPLDYQLHSPYPGRAFTDVYAPIQHGSSRTHTSSASPSGSIAAADTQSLLRGIFDELNGNS